MILYSIELLSGLKINFDKTRVFDIGLTAAEIEYFASLLGCQAEQFPFLYLGIPLHFFNLKSKDWNFLLERIDKKLSGWKRKTLSIAGRLTLINSVLRAIPLHWMSVFSLPSGIIRKIDKMCRIFLWGIFDRGGGVKNLASWLQICRPKALGGLGIINLRTANRALLLKWWFKFFSNSDRPW